MSAQPYTREEIERIRRDTKARVTQTPFIDTKWLATLDAREAEIAALRGALTEVLALVRKTCSLCDDTPDDEPLEPVTTLGDGITYHSTGFSDADGDSYDSPCRYAAVKATIERVLGGEAKS